MASEAEVRTNVVVDKALLARAQRLGRLKTKRSTIHEALKAYVAIKQQQKILRLEGKIHWEGDLRAMRGGRFVDDPR